MKLTEKIYKYLNEGEVKLMNDQTFRMYLNEASTLTKLGVTMEQIRKIYTRHTGIKHDAKFKKLKSKKALKKEMRSPREILSSIVAIKNNGDIFFVTNDFGKFDLQDYTVTEITVDGKIVNDWRDIKGVNKVLARLNDVKDYYFSNDSSVKLSRYSGKMPEDPEFFKEINSAVKSILAPFLQKEIDKNKAKLIKMIDNNEYRNVDANIDKLRKGGVFGDGGSFKGIDLQTFAERGWGNNSMSQILSKEVEDGLDWNQVVTPKDVRKAASGIIKKIKQDIITYFSGV